MIIKKPMRLLPIVLILFPAVIAARQSKSPNAQEPRVAPIEVVQVLEFPVNLREAVLVNTDKGYLLRCSLSNNSESKTLGLDYLLLLIDANNAAQAIVNVTEEFKLDGYATKRLTSRTPLKLKVSDGYRLILMPQRAYSSDSIWEVLKARKALEAYTSGDYSVTPTVVRVTNHVDTPPPSRVIY